MPNKNPTTESEIAPVQKRVERQGQQSVPFTKYYPQVRGGHCEHCGVIDPNQPSHLQYKLCPHFRGMELRCSYCDASKDPEEVNGRAVLNIHDHPTSPGLLVVVCDSYTCSEKHLARFELSR